MLSLLVLLPCFDDGSPLGVKTPFLLITLGNTRNLPEILRRSWLCLARGIDLVLSLGVTTPLINLVDLVFLGKFALICWKAKHMQICSDFFQVGDDLIGSTLVDMCEIWLRGEICLRLTLYHFYWFILVTIMKSFPNFPPILQIHNAENRWKFLDLEHFSFSFTEVLKVLLWYIR